MRKILRFDKSRRKTYRSDAEMKRIAAMTARAVERDKRRKHGIGWKWPMAVFVITFLIAFFVPDFW